MIPLKEKTGSLSIFPPPYILTVTNLKSEMVESVKKWVVYAEEELALRVCTKCMFV